MISILTILVETIIKIIIVEITITTDSPNQRPVIYLDLVIWEVAASNKTETAVVDMTIMIYSVMTIFQTTKTKTPTSPEPKLKLKPKVTRALLVMTPLIKWHPTPIMMMML